MGVIGTRTDDGFTEIRTGRIADVSIGIAKRVFNQNTTWRLIHWVEKRKLNKS